MTIFCLKAKDVRRIFLKQHISFILEKKAVTKIMTDFHPIAFEDASKHIAKKVNKFEKNQIIKNNIHGF
jgi:hypothetical protein